MSNTIELNQELFSLLGNSVGSPPDYCGSWAFTGPLMTSHGISLIKMKSGYQAVHDWDYIDLSDFDDINDCCIGHDDTSYGHENALVAVVTVLILILRNTHESKNKSNHPSVGCTLR